MDGWETRRKRIPGHDWCIIELGLPGVISSVHIDTAYFTGNNAPQCSIQGTCVDMPLPKLTLDVPPGEMGTCASPQDLALEHNTWHSAQWETLLPRSPLASGYPDTRYHVFDLAAKSSSRYTHLRLNVFPDGGIARLRVRVAAYFGLGWGGGLSPNPNPKLLTLVLTLNFLYTHRPDVGLWASGDQLDRDRIDGTTRSLSSDEWRTGHQL